ncbi:hypothetical protein C8Q77DRAFT_665799 [Trametes polyzona]|nr:hypothetical protein C8Q77DRAFT_665799 [Trametes polyzona]
MSRRLPPNLKHLYGARATPQAQRLVLSLIEKKQALTIQELYNLAQQEQSQQAAPGGGEAEPIIRSMRCVFAASCSRVRTALTRPARYLKKVVLPSLKSEGKIQQVHTKQVLTPEELETLKANMGKNSRKAATLPSRVDLWRWQLKEDKPAPQWEEKPVFGAEVGVGADWSHLNKRRQRARQESVGRDVAWLKDLRRAREEEAA